MTRETFLAALATTAERYQWYLRDGYDLRARDATGGYYCPITLVLFNATQILYAPWQAMAAARHLGLATEEAAALTEAADASTSHDPVLRQALLTAVGLGSTPAG